MSAVGQNFEENLKEQLAEIDPVAVFRAITCRKRACCSKDRSEHAG